MSSTYADRRRPKVEDDADEDPLVSLRAVAQQALDSFNNIWDFAAQSLPQIITFLILIPILFVLSLSAGWIVRKSVPVGWSEVVYLQYGDGQTPYANFTLSNLVPDQPYHISVDLILPPTPSNNALGNFMTSLTFTSRDKTIASIRRPSVIPHAGTPSTLSRLLLSQPSSIKMNVPLLDSWTPGRSRLDGVLEVGRRDGWKSVGNGEGREVTVLEAVVRGEVNLQGTRRIIQNHPNLSTLFSAGLFFALSLIGASICFLSSPFSSRSRPTYKPMHHVYEPPKRRFAPSERMRRVESVDESSRSPSPTNGLRMRRPLATAAAGDLSPPLATPELGDMQSE